MSAVIEPTTVKAYLRPIDRDGLMKFAAAGGIAVEAHTDATCVPGFHERCDCVAVNGRASRCIEPIARQARDVAASILGRPVPAAAATAPVLRVKTSAMPIAVSYPAPHGAAPATVLADWQITLYDADPRGCSVWTRRAVSSPGWWPTPPAPRPEDSAPALGRRTSWRSAGRRQSSRRRETQVIGA